METERQGAGAEAWRVVVITNIPGGLIYTTVRDVLAPLGHRVVGVLTSPGPKRRRSDAYLGVVAAVSPGIDVIVSNHPERWAAMLAPLQPDLIICGGMPWKIPAEVLALPRLGAINLHPALLPKYRGPSAVEWAMRNGDAEMGFTVHRIAADFDTGPILAQERLPIADDDDLGSLMVKFGPVVPRVLAAAIARVARGEAGEPQDEALASYAGMFEPEWREIDWRKPARTIHNQVRSWVGFRDVPGGAFGEVDGERLHITRTSLLPAEPAGVPTTPGTVLRREGETLIVQCGDGPLALVAWTRAEPESGAGA